MNINNTTNGNVIKINKIKDTGTFYNIYENTYCAENNLYPIKKKTDARDTTLVPSEPMNEEDLRKHTSKLKILEAETNFELSDDEQNWLIDSRPIRMLMKNTFLNEVLTKDEHRPLSIIIREELDANYNSDEKFIFVGNNYQTAYFLDIDDEDEPIITPYIAQGKIIIENKNT